jgi:hypothetical protein
VLAVVAVLATTSGAARAEGAACPAPAGASPALASVDGETRLEAIRDVMHHQASRARTWTWTWVGIGLGLTAVGWAQYPFVDSDKRLPQAVTSTAPLFIVGQTLLFPLRVTGDADAIDADKEGDTCARLARAEALLEATAEDEREHTGVVAHVFTLTLSAAYMAGLAIAFKDPRYTFVDGAGSFVVGEAQLLSTPTGARDALERYRAGDTTNARFKATRWTIAPVGAGLGVFGVF